MCEGRWEFGRVVKKLLGYPYPISECLGSSPACRTQKLKIAVPGSQLLYLPFSLSCIFIHSTKTLSPVLSNSSKSYSKCSSEGTLKKKP